MRKGQAGEAQPSRRVFDFRALTRKGCAGNPVTFLRSLFARVALQANPGETAEVLLDIGRAKVSPNGAATIARNAGLEVAAIETRPRGILSLVVKTGA